MTVKELIDRLSKCNPDQRVILDNINQLNLQKGDKVKWMYSFSGWRDTTPIEKTGTFIRWKLIIDGGMIKPFIPKYIKSAIGVGADIKNDRCSSNELDFVCYYFNGRGTSDTQNEFETLEKF